MRNPRRYFSTLSLLVAALVVAGGGCSSVGNAIDCAQLCRELRDCVDGNLNVSRCEARCEDDANTDDQFDNQLDECTDCLDEDYSCSEIPKKCKACKTLTEILT